MDTESKEVDYPAAHSMDTCFFAIDCDGRVACFDTGEEGAVLHDAYGGDEAWDLRNRLKNLLPRCEVIHVRDAQFVPSTPEKERHCAFGDDWPVENCVLFLDSLEPVQAEMTAGRARPVPANEGSAILLYRMSLKTFRDLHKQGLCRGCFLYYYGPREGDTNDVSGFGIYYYDHLDGPCASPYGQVTRPNRPIHIDQLPPDARKLVGQMRLDLSFADTLIVQPAEHGPCSAWGGAYLDSTGKVIRPIPGQEDMFYESLGDLDELRKFYEIEDPASEDE